MKSLTIRQYPVEAEDGEALDDDDDPTARARALEMMPSYERLKAGIGKQPPGTGRFRQRGDGLLRPADTNLA